MTANFGANNSSNLLAALILGTVIDCVEADQAENTNKHEKKVTMYSVINMFQEMANIEDEDGRTMLDHYFINRPDRDLAKMKYAAVGLAGARTKGSIFSNLLAKLTVFTYQEIAKSHGRIFNQFGGTLDLEKGRQQYLLVFRIMITLRISLQVYLSGNYTLPLLKKRRLQEWTLPEGSYLYAG